MTNYQEQQLQNMMFMDKIREKSLQQEQLTDHHVAIDILAEVVEVNDVKNTFSVDFCIEIHGDIISQQSDLPKEKRWIPTFSLFNTNDEKTLSPHGTFRKGTHGRDVYVLNWLAVCREALELKRFPFDRQLLQLSFEGRNCTYDIHTVDIGSFLPNWRLINTITPRQKGKQTKLPIKIERRIAYYWWNVVFVLFLLNLLAFSVVATSAEEFSSRQSTSITLVLSGVASKLSLAQTLPQIPYLTVMDYYVVFSFLLVALMVLENFIMKFLATSSLGLAATQNIDYIVVGSMCGLWIFLHFILFLCFQFGLLRQGWDYVEKHQEKAQVACWYAPLEEMNKDKKAERRKKNQRKKNPRRKK